MLTAFRTLLMSPVTGLVASGVAVALATALGILSNDWQSQRADYETRIAELNHAATKVKSDLQSELSACHSAREAQSAEVAAYVPRPAVSANARRLLERQPEGIDACARMESADHAVLSNLKK